MNSESWKWLVAGLLGAVLTMATLIAGFYYSYRYLINDILDVSIADDVEPIYGPDEWAEERDESDEEAAGTAERLKQSGLAGRYTTVYVLDDTRHELYLNHNFTVVESRLQTAFEKARTPLERHRYSQMITSLGDFTYHDDPAKLLATLNDWVAARPESYFAHLIRGSFAFNYAWYFRGSGYVDEVPKEGWKGFQDYLVIARDDLEQAMALNPGDPEAPALMAPIPFLIDSDRPAMNRLIDKTLALNPFHVGIRSTALNYATPRWGGSNQKIRSVIADCDAHMTEFPLLVEVKRMALFELDEDTWDAPETEKMMFHAYAAQSKLDPDDLQVLGTLASYAVYTRHFDVASDAMHHIGDRFPDGCPLSEIPSYHHWRATAYAEHSQMEGVLGTPREGQLLKDALELAPEDNVVAPLYLGYLGRQRDDLAVQVFYTTCQDPYLVTGKWDDPPNYNMIEGMAKAGRSDDWGIQGTDLERPLLDEAYGLAPDNAFVRLVFAEYFITNEQFDAAEEHLQAARELDPDYLPALHIMGWLHFHQKRWDEGIATARAFLATEPSPYLKRFKDDAQEIIDLCEENKTDG